MFHVGGDPQGSPGADALRTDGSIKRTLSAVNYDEIIEMYEHVAAFAVSASFW